MRVLAKIVEWAGRAMAAIVLATAALALFAPETCLWIRLEWVNRLLMLVMFGMGLALRPGDFAPVFRRPRDVLTGCAAQFVLMPLFAICLSKAFGLDPALTAGVVLVGTCPGGTSSNVITYLSRGDTALSVGMTAVNTLLAPLLTPAIAYLLLRATVRVDVASMFLSIVTVVIVPIALGFAANRLFGNATRKAAEFLPLVSVAAICMIVASVVSHNAEKILSTGAVVFAVVVLHNLLGYAAGFGLGRILKLPPAKTKALSVEIGMQNSGLATALAASAFPALAMATVPGAVFSVWHNISGAVLANVYRRWNGKNPGAGTSSAPSA